MRDLNETEVAEIAGGVVAGPNGEGCTDPRSEDDKYQTPTQSQTLSQFIIAIAAGA